MLFLEALGQDSASPLCLFGNHWLVGALLQPFDHLFYTTVTNVTNVTNGIWKLTGYTLVKLLKEEGKSFQWNQIQKLLGWKTDWLNSSAPSLNNLVFLIWWSVRSNVTLLQEPQC